MNKRKIPEHLWKHNRNQLQDSFVLGIRLPYDPLWFWLRGILRITVQFEMALIISLINVTIHQILFFCTPISVWLINYNQRWVTCTSAAEHVCLWANGSKFTTVTKAHTNISNIWHNAETLTRQPSRENNVTELFWCNLQTKTVFEQSSWPKKKKNNPYLGLPLLLSLLYTDAAQIKLKISRFQTIKQGENVIEREKIRARHYRFVPAWQISLEKGLTALQICSQT